MTATDKVYNFLWTLTLSYGKQLNIVPVTSLMHLKY